METFGVHGRPIAALPAGPGSAARTAGPTAREALRRGGGPAEARSPVLGEAGDRGLYTVHPD